MIRTLAVNAEQQFPRLQALREKIQGAVVDTAASPRQSANSLVNALNDAHRSILSSTPAPRLQAAPSSPLPSRPAVLSLYRSLIRSASHLPTSNRVSFVLARSRLELDLNRHVVGAAAVEELRIVGDTHLDTVRVQAAHLNKVFGTPGYHSDQTAEETRAFFAERRKNREA